MDVGIIEKNGKDTAYVSENKTFPDPRQILEAAPAAIKKLVYEDRKITIKDFHLKGEDGRH